MWPSMRAVGTSSCIRLSARRKVDFPQPLGPMMAVTARAWTSMDTRLSTCVEPKYTERSRTQIAVDDGEERFGAATGAEPTSGSMRAMMTGFTFSVVIGEGLSLAAL